MNNTEKTVEERILDAAYHTFVEKGYEGAKMRDIASRADINISMLHYYYRSKDNLFDIAFSRAFENVYGEILKILSSRDMNIHDKIIAIVDQYISSLTENPLLPGFLIREITKNDIKDKEARQKFAPYIEQLFKAAAVLESQLKDEVSKGNIRSVNLMEFLMDIESVCMYPFLNRGLWQRVFDVPDEEFNQKMRSRKETFINNILKSLEK